MENEKETPAADAGKKKPEVKRTEHTLKKDHEHGGKTVPAGEKVLLRDDQAERLRKQGKI